MVVPGAEPWISTGIEKGSRWEAEIAQNLEVSDVGIVCLTAENLNARWVLFEAGALSKRLNGKVATLLLDVTDTQIEPPLAQFQHTKSEQGEILALMEAINKRVGETDGKGRTDSDLRDAFTKFWPDLELVIADLRANRSTAAAPARKVEDMVAEILLLTRANMQQGWMQEKALKMLHQIYRATFGTATPSLAELRRIVASGSWVGAAEAVIPPSDPLRSIHADTPLPLRAEAAAQQQADE